MDKNIEEIKKNLAQLYAMLPEPVDNTGTQFTLSMRVGNKEYTFVFIIDYHVIPTRIQVDEEVIFDNVRIVKYWMYSRVEIKESACLEGSIITTSKFNGKLTNLTGTFKMTDLHNSTTNVSCSFKDRNVTNGGEY